MSLPDRFSELERVRYDLARRRREAGDAISVLLHEANNLATAAEHWPFFADADQRAINARIERLIVAWTGLSHATRL